MNGEQGFPHVFYFGKQDILNLGRYVIEFEDIYLLFVNIIKYLLSTMEVNLLKQIMSYY